MRAKIVFPFIEHIMISSSVGTNEQNHVSLLVSKGDHSAFLIIITDLYFLLCLKCLF